MHLRGSAFEFDIVGPRGYVDTLLKAKPYDFNWQLNYVLKTPRLLRKGTTLRWTGYFDNSPNNPANPDFCGRSLESRAGRNDDRLLRTSQLILR